MARSDLLRAAFQERFQPLRDRDRALLLRAALIGPRFDVALLRELSGFSNVQVERSLRAACRLQIIEPAPPPRGRYRFRHALTRDAAYDALIAEHLRPLHRAIGEALERLTSERQPELEELAFHWWAAADAAHGTRYNEEAGDRARALYAFDEALTYYGRALELAVRLPDVAARLRAKIAAFDHGEATTMAFRPGK